LPAAWRFLGTLFLSIPFAFSFRRGAFVGGAGALILATAWVTRTPRRVALVACAAGLVLLAFAMNSVLSAVTTVEAGARAAISSTSSAPGENSSTAPGPATANLPPPPEAGDIDASNEFRLLDAKNALLNIRDHPLAGIGLGAPYRIYDDGGVAPGPFLLYATRTSHSGYLALPLKTGLPGLILFLVFITSILAPLVGAIRRDTEARLLLSFVAIWAVINVTSPLIESVRPATLLGLVLARALRFRRGEGDILGVAVPSAPEATLERA
jgi:O-antigen ligase